MSRTIDIERLKREITKEELEKISEEDIDSFYGSSDYFNKFPTGKNGKQKKVLSKSKELELGKILEQYKNGESINNAQVVIAYNKLFKYNMIKVYKQVWSFFKLNKAYLYDMENAIQDCLMELHRGIMEYEPSLNCSVYTRVHYLVSKKLSTESNKSRPIPVTATGGYKIFKIKSVIEDYLEENGVEPGNDYIKKEVKNRYGNVISDIELISLRGAATGVVSLDKTVNNNDGDEFSTDNFYGVIENGYEATELRSVIDTLTADLTFDDKELLMYYYGMNSIYNSYTENELADELGITISELKRAVRKILNSIRKTVKEKGITIV